MLSQTPPARNHETKDLHRRLLKFFAILLIAVAISGRIFAQQPDPSPSPKAVGRSYSSDEVPKTPPPAGPRALSPVTFTDVTSLTKIDFKHAGSPTPTKYLLETMGGGVAIFDYDNDGRMDLFFTNGALLKEGMSKDSVPDKSDPRFWNRLYHQKADGTFEDVTARSGLKGDGYSMGVAAGDYDNDGNIDLYVTGYGANHLFRNTGSGTFVDVATKLGVGGSGWSTSAAWLDYDRDGRLDLFVARYMDWDFEKGSILCGDSRGTRAYCHPENFKGATNMLFHQRVNGTFEDVTLRAGVADPTGKALGVALADFDNDGFTDIFVANDSVRQSLYHNNADGTFEDIAVGAGAGYDEDGKTYAGMGVDAADFDNDGFADVFCTTLSYQTYPLYHNNGDLSFSYVTKSTAVGQISLLYSGWGVHFIDADNDGWRDIFVAQGHVLDTIEQSFGYLKYKQTPLLMRNLGDTFTNISATAGGPFNSPLAARGAAFGDLNNDGQVDIVIGVVDGPPVILRNAGTRNHWLGIRLIGGKSNRDGVGARVTITDDKGHRQIYDQSTSGSYLSASDPRILAGLGIATGVRGVEVRWPSGRTQSVLQPPIDRYITLDEREIKEEK
jgi:enediyne biosynthesis protein E4